MKKLLVLVAALLLMPDMAYAGRVRDKIVVEECGACHNAFRPRYLPAQSWQTIMRGLDDHFGEDATLDQETIDYITKYLTRHASRSRRWRRVKSPPLRITRLGWFRGEHGRRAKPRRGGSWANCRACHRSM